MTARFYVLPITRITDEHGRVYRSPKYLPDLGVSYGMIPFANLDYCVACADVTAQQQNTIAANSDVLAIPANIESTLNAAAVTTARTFLTSIDIPASWITVGMTYHYVLKIVCGFFLFFQRVLGILGRDINLVAGWPNVPFQNIALDIQSSIVDAANSLKYDLSWMQPDTTLGDILKSMSDDWGAEIIHVGIADL